MVLKVINRVITLKEQTCSEMCYLVDAQLRYGMYRFTRKIQYNQSWSSQAVGIGSYGNRTPHTSTHAAQLHSSLSQKHNTFCEGLNGSVLKSFHFGAYESELVMAALSGPVVTRGGATLFCLLFLELFLPARPAAALPGSSRHGRKHWPCPWDARCFCPASKK